MNIINDSAFSPLAFSGYVPKQEQEKINDDFFNELEDIEDTTMNMDNDQEFNILLTNIDIDKDANQRIYSKVFNGLAEPFTSSLRRKPYHCMIPKVMPHAS